MNIYQIWKYEHCLNINTSNKPNHVNYSAYTTNAKHQSQKVAQFITPFQFYYNTNLRESMTQQKKQHHKHIITSTYLDSATTTPTTLRLHGATPLVN